MGSATEAGRNFVLPPSSFRLAAAAFLVAAALSGCGMLTTQGEKPSTPPTVSKAPDTEPVRRPGGYYLDDGPGDKSPADFDHIPEPTPRIEPLHRAATRPYVVMGRSYTPMTALAPYKDSGLATWYGRRYHGKPTSSGEIYDMYAISAAHPTLPIPSYARVTHMKTGKSIVVRINDRGPFYDGRIIDLSYTAAYRLGILGGATMVEVESILPGSGGTIIAAKPPSPQPDRQSAIVAASPLPAVDAKPAITEPPTPGPGLSIISSAAAEPLPASAATTSKSPLPNEAGQLYLQLGAFGSRENAESYLATLRSQADWLALQVFARDGLFRVQAGPYANQNEARQMAERLSQTLGVKPLLLTR